MLRGRRYAGAILDHPELDEAVGAVEVRPAIVVADHAGAPVRRQHLAPALEPALDPSQELAPVGFEPRGEIRAEAGEAVGDRRADRRHRPGVEREVRVARRMHVSERAIHAPGGDLQQREALSGLDDARRAAEQARVAAALDDRIDPGVLLEAVANQDLGALDEQDLTRPDLEVVGILPGSCGDVDAAQISHDATSDGPEIGQGGEDAQGRLGGQIRRRERAEEAGEHADGGDEAQGEESRPPHQKRSVGCAPRMNVPWRKNSLATRSTAPVPSVCLYCARKRRNSDGLNWR